MKLEVNMYNKFLWNRVVIEQGVFNRLKASYNISSSMNNFENLLKNLILAIRNF